MIHTARELFESQVADKIGYLVASGAIASPWILPGLKEVSEGAAMLAPILGCCWLVVQIIVKTTYFFRDKPDE